MIRRDQHTFDDNCEITLENVLDNFDHYYLCHLLGWFVLSFSLRDRFLLHTWACLDELVELTWQHILPHLRECWWDHIFIDILLSNTVGIELALFVIDLIGFKRYDWLGKEGKKSWREWRVFNCHRNFGTLIEFYGFVVIRFLSMFFFLNALFLPPRHIVSGLRVAGWGFFAFLPFREMYEDVRTWNTPERKDHRVEGNYRWLGISVITVECFVSYKFRLGTGNMNENVETPIYKIIPWAIVIISAVAYYLKLRLSKNRTRKFKDAIQAQIKDSAKIKAQ